MLSRKEEQISSLLNITVKSEKEINEVLAFEKKYNKNSIEILHLKENLTSDFIRWQLLVEKLIYFNNDFYKINKINDIVYITYNNRMSKEKFTNYLDLVKSYQKKNPNMIFLMSNKSEYYKRILSGLNHRDIITLFLTDNKEDLYLEYTNVITQYTENLKNIAKLLKPKVLNFEIEEVF